MSDATAFAAVCEVAGESGVQNLSWVLAILFGAYLTTSLALGAVTILTSSDAYIDKLQDASVKIGGAAGSTSVSDTLVNGMSAGVSAGGLRLRG